MRSKKTRKLNKMETMESMEMEGVEPETVEPETEPDSTGSPAGPDPEAPPVAPPQCGAWAFVLAPMLGAFCPLVPGHEGDHQAVINVFAEPQARFMVTWALGDPAAVERRVDV